MVATKSKLFTKEEVELSNVGKALSHPARIKILKVLSEQKICMMGDIATLLPLAQSTVSQHLSELKKAGLIKGEIEGPKVCYCINEKQLSKAKTELSKLLNKICNC